MREYCKYRSRWGGTSCKFGHLRLACQMGSAVWTPMLFASMFLARMMPWRLSLSPATAMGTSLY